MHQKTTYKNSKQALTKVLCVCILCVYALFPIGDFITTATHKASHIFTSISNNNHAHNHSMQHHTHDGRYGEMVSSNESHEHLVVNFLSAAFSSDTDPVNAPQKITLSLDTHLNSETLDFSFLQDIDSKLNVFSIFQKLIIRFSENSTPPPRQ